MRFKVFLQSVGVFGDVVPLRYMYHLARNIKKGVNHVNCLKRSDPLPGTEEPFRLILDLDQRLLNRWNIRDFLIRKAFVEYYP